MSQKQTAVGMLHITVVPSQVAEAKGLGMVRPHKDSDIDSCQSGLLGVYNSLLAGSHSRQLLSLQCMLVQCETGCISSPWNGVARYTHVMPGRAHHSQRPLRRC